MRTVRTATTTDQSDAAGGRLDSSTASVEKQSRTENSIDVKNMAATIKAMGMNTAIINWGSPSKLATNNERMPAAMKTPNQTKT